jgi:hypothetical protein
MTDSNPMQNLYARLEDAGVSEDYVRSYVLPEWWDDEIAESSAGFLEGLGYVSKYLNLNLGALRDADASLSFQNDATARFKLNSGRTPSEVTWAQNLAHRVAEMATHASDRPFQSDTDLTPTAIRQRILDAGAPWVDLECLTTFCWDAGIPVLYVPDVPGRKMDGVALLANERPAIVISKAHKHQAWLLFVLAHELGHIAHEHLREQEAWGDDWSETRMPDDKDPREQAANQFAVQVITGSPDTRVNSPYMEATNLAKVAERVGRENQIDPGALILNFAFHATGNPWPLANAALNVLVSETHAPDVIRSVARERLNWGRLPDESVAFLCRIMGIDRTTVGAPVNC